jgi:hypothetical protein
VAGFDTRASLVTWVPLTGEGPLKNNNKTKMAASFDFDFLEIIFKKRTLLAGPW